MFRIKISNKNLHHTHINTVEEKHFLTYKSFENTSIWMKIRNEKNWLQNFFLLKLIFAINITKIMHAAMSKHYNAYEGLRLTIIFVTYNTSFVPMCYFINVSLKYT